MNVGNPRDLGHVYLIKTDDDLRAHLAAMIRDAGFTMAAFASVQEFVNKSGFEAPAVLVLDLKLRFQTVRMLENFLEVSRRQMPIIAVGKQEDHQSTIGLFSAIKPKFLVQPHSRESLIALTHQLLRLDLANPDNPNNRVYLMRCYEALTPREQEVLQLLVRGFPAASVAQLLDVSVGTIHSHRAAIYARFGDIKVKDFRRFFDMDEVFIQHAFQAANQAAHTKGLVRAV